MNEPQTANAVNTLTRGWMQFHVWSREWPKPNRRYEGTVWAQDEYEAGTEARKQFGNRGRVYDIQSEKNGGILRKGA
jgi:1,2-phenylacetyl-CoA epoxidase PaaB subunit